MCHTSLIAGLVVSVVDPQPGETIIDCCAAPGGKTLYMASHLSGQGINLSKNLLKSYWISISLEVIINVSLIFFFFRERNSPQRLLVSFSELSL